MLGETLNYSHRGVPTEKTSSLDLHLRSSKVRMTTIIDARGRFGLRNQRKRESVISQTSPEVILLSAPVKCYASLPEVTHRLCMLHGVVGSHYSTMVIGIVHSCFSRHVAALGSKQRCTSSRNRGVHNTLMLYLRVIAKSII